MNEHDQLVLGCKTPRILRRNVSVLTGSIPCVAAEKAISCFVQSTIWLLNIAMEKSPFLIGKPSINGPLAIFHGYVK